MQFGCIEVAPVGFVVSGVKDCSVGAGFGPGAGVAAGEIGRPGGQGRPGKHMRDALICAAVEAYLEPGPGNEGCALGEALATQQTTDLAGLGATVGFLEYPQPVLGAEPPPGPLCHNLRIGPPEPARQHPSTSSNRYCLSIVVHLHRPTLIPRVVDVSTMLAESVLRRQPRTGLS